MGEHARLSPSAADRWMRCPGSIEAEAKEPDDDNIFSAQGTVAHMVQERCLKYGFEPVDFLGKVYKEGNKKQFEITVDDEMVEYLEPIIDEIRDTGGHHYYETRVDLSKWLPGQFGTLDVGIGLPKKNLIIIRDLKYGAGLPVRAEDNAQLRIYAAGIWDMIFSKLWLRLGIRERPTFKIIIDQPRHSAGGGEDIVSYAELMQFMVDVKRAGAKTYGKNAPRIAGDKQCGYCKAAQNRHCKEYDAWNIQKWGGKFDAYQKGRTVDPPEPDSMDPDMRALILQQAPALKQWLSRLHAAHINACMAGQPGGGLKVVESRKGHRKWTDEKEAEKWLDENVPEHADIYKPRTIISPAQAQKFFGKNGKAKVAPLVTQPDGKPVLVSEKDPRPAMKRASESFLDYADEEED